MSADARGDDPTPPFTVVELEIAELAGKGYGAWRIALLLRRRPGYIRQRVWRMAQKLPTIDGVEPLARIQLWGAHRQWLKTRPTDSDRAA
jgi:hypothetical protein